MEERYFGWDEISDGLLLLSTQKTEDEHTKKTKLKSDSNHVSKVYCPHSYLILNFHETLSQRDKLKFRKYYLRKVAPNEPNVIILQDIKNLVMYLLISHISPQFVNFFYLPIVDRFLRAAILYFQYYVITWEELMKERTATMKKAPNPLAQGYRYRYAEEMQILRCVLGREYADLIVGCHDVIQYHHMTGGKKGAPSVTQSQGEKDLRIFEVLICMTHRIVWIALERKYFSLIEIELHRLFRTETYNIAERRSHIIQDMLPNDIQVLQGHKIQVKRKLLRNSPLIQGLIYSDSDYRLLSLGIEDNSNDERILYLKYALVAEEDKLHKLGIKVGILGENRTNYDILLMPLEEKNEEQDKTQLSDRRKHEKRKSIKDTMQDTQISIKVQRLPSFQTKPDLTQDFSTRTINISPKGYKVARQKARKKWLIREIKRQGYKETDTYSIATVID
ncbi:protein phosphatase 1 regulatory subunit 36 isoform X1 [Bombus fervidus]|uniref:protein phosphatase 1 regulatory subunit 36 isoform X1 n=1 Tax=Bombus fervidus TaxID=203811 RepID=UPI003AB293F4